MKTIKNSIKITSRKNEGFIQNKIFVISLAVILIVFGLIVGFRFLEKDVEKAEKAVEVPEIIITTEELIGGMIKGLHEMETVRFETKAVSTVKFNTKIFTMDVTGSGVVDFVNEKMKITKHSLTPILDKVIEVKMEVYYLDGMMYKKTTMPDVVPVWIKREAPWDLVSPARISIKLLEAKGSEVEILGIEEINGISSYAIKIIPDIEVFSEIMTREIRRLRPEMTEKMYFEDVIIREWIAKDTLLEVKGVIEMTKIAEGMTIEMITTSWFYDHNKPVVIELPIEATDAVIK